MTGGQGRFATRFLLAVAVTVGLGGTLVLAAGALAALPALLAFLPLFAGRYLGADRLESLIERRRGAPTYARVPARRPRRSPVAFRARGGRLLAFSLAKRPPPAAAAAR